MTPNEILRACAEQGTESTWAVFVQTFQPLIANSISRVVRRNGFANPALIDDLTQETFLRLCKEDGRLLREFQVRHENAIFGYIKVIAISVALDYFRARTSQKRVAEVQADESHPEMTVYAGAIEQAAMLEELDRHLAATESDRDRAIFWLYYRQGYSAREISTIPEFSLTQKGIESCIHRMTGLLRSLVSASRPETSKKLEGKTVRSTLGEMK